MLPDNTLVGMFRGGDRRAGEELCRRYQGAIKRYCSVFLHDQDAAQDAAQDTFLAVIRNVKDLHDDLSFKGWLYRIARNTCLTVARRTSREVRLEDSEEVWEGETPLSIALNGELYEMAEKALTLLRPIYREAFLLRERESLSYGEIAEATQVPVSSVKFRIHRARRALAELLSTYLDERREP